MMDSTPAAGSWRARLDLNYGWDGVKTVLKSQDRRGPLFVQKPFYPEGSAVCHTYVVHPPGGVVGGDMLGLGVRMAPESHAVLTTPAAGKFYRSVGPAATQINQLHVSDNACLEWLPQETIIYNRAKVEMKTIVNLSGNARFIGWEMICLGLPASKQPFTGGRINQAFEIWHDNRPLFIEPFRVRENDPLLTARWGMAGKPVIGTMIATIDREESVAAVRQITGKMDIDGLFAVTRIGRLTVCRFLGDDVYTGLKVFARVWEVLRPAMTGRDACMPRIWAT